jgi:toxin ParE1/3/4
MRLPFEAEAVAELEAAAAWYEHERQGFGTLLVSEVRRAVNRAADLPRSGRRVSGTEPARDVRRFVVRRFPYVVVTAIIAGQRAVVAVAHDRRRPGYWRDRLK